jgi:hypothetical protein
MTRRSSATHSIPVRTPLVALIVCGLATPSFRGSNMVISPTILIGTELDALVQTRVMGLPGRWVESILINETWRTKGRTWLDTSYQPDSPPGGQMAYAHPPPYSREIMIAWRIVEKLAGQGVPFHMWWTGESWSVAFGADADLVLTGRSRTDAAYYICCAAIRYKGYR